MRSLRFKGLVALALVLAATAAPAALTERYVSRLGGGAHDGTTAADAFTLAEAITHSTTNTGIRYNVIADTYPNTTTTRTFSGSGLVTAPNVWRGYKATIGDMDGFDTSHGTFGAATEVPYFTWTTAAGACAVTGQYQIFQNIDFISQNQNGSTVGTVYTSNGPNWFVRCRIENSAANSNSYGVFSSGARCHFFCCGVKATSSAPCVGANAKVFLDGCHLRGGSDGLWTNATGCEVRRTIFDDNGDDAMQVSGDFLCDGNSVYSPASDGVQIDSAGHSLVINTIFSACGAYDVNNTAANNFLVKRFGNLSHSPGTAHETGFGDVPSYFDQTDSASPFVDAANGDFTPATGSNALNNAIPTDFSGLRW